VRIIREAEEPLDINVVEIVQTRVAQVFDNAGGTMPLARLTVSLAASAGWLAPIASLTFCFFCDTNRESRCGLGETTSKLDLVTG
jgi:hypothetical protein